MPDAMPARMLRPDGSAPDLGSPNARAVYRDLLRFGPRSRSELTSRLGLSAPTVTRAARDLLDAGWLHTLGPVARAKGRPHEPLDIEENEGPRFLGVKVTADEVHAVASTVRGNVLEELTLPLESTTPTAVVEAIAGPVEALTGAHPHLLGLGISVGGRVADRRTVLGSQLLDWDQPVPLAQMLEERLHLPTVVENDLRAMLHGLHWFGVGRSYRSFALLTVGAGVGIGVVHAGELVEGRAHVAGLTGMLPVGQDAEGRTLTFTEAASLGPLLERAQRAGILHSGAGLPELRDLVAQGHEGARELVAEMARSLARAAASVAAMLDPEAILLGGETRDLVRSADPVLEDTLRASLAPMQQDIAVRDLPGEYEDWARAAPIAANQQFDAPARGGVGPTKRRTAVQAFIRTGR